MLLSPRTFSKHINQPVFKISIQVKRMEMEQKDCSTKVEKLIEKHAWIASEKQLFGRSGTDYDFASRNPKKAREELDKLQAEQSGFETGNFLLFTHLSSL